MANVYYNVLAEVNRNRDTHYTFKDYHKNNDNQYGIVEHQEEISYHKLIRWRGGNSKFVTLSEAKHWVGISWLSLPRLQHRNKTNLCVKCMNIFTSNDKTGIQESMICRCVYIFTSNENTGIVLHNVNNCPDCGALPFYCRLWPMFLFGIWNRNNLTLDLRTLRYVIFPTNTLNKY